jgi:flagellar hook-basal body complex protein FliE
MSNMQINSVLSQIRALSSQINSSQIKSPSADAIGQAVKPGDAVQASSFADVLKQGLGQVNQVQQRADQLSTAFQRGEAGVELSDVMIEMQKANVSFRAVTEVRNRMVSAYQEIMNMQI